MMVVESDDYLLLGGSVTLVIRQPRCSTTWALQRMLKNQENPSGMNCPISWVLSRMSLTSLAKSSVLFLLLGINN
jgi:hypothetical protein